MNVSIRARSKKEAEQLMAKVRENNPHSVVDRYDVEIEGRGPIIINSLSIIGWSLFGLAICGVFNRNN